MSMKPDEAELRDRIERHFAARPGDGTVAAVWQGYLAALIEWRLLEPSVEARLLDLLPSQAGAAEAVEILSGEVGTTPQPAA